MDKINDENYKEFAEYLEWLGIDSKRVSSKEALNGVLSPQEIINFNNGLYVDIILIVHMLDEVGRGNFTSFSITENIKYDLLDDKNDIERVNQKLNNLIKSWKPSLEKFRKEEKVLEVNKHNFKLYIDFKLEEKTYNIKDETFKKVYEKLINKDSTMEMDIEPGDLIKIVHNGSEENIVNQLMECTIYYCDDYIFISDPSGNVDVLYQENVDRFIHI